MSRCFPFPPPGYVKKARADDVDLVKKGTERGKKHKKERRDKEKREGKERKEKDRTEGKHRDKKEKKDRHRDKRKDREKDKEKEKERDREKDLGGTSEERRISQQQTDGRNSKERIVNKDRPPKQIPGTSGQVDKEKSRTHIPDARRVDGLSARGGSAPKSLEKNQNFQKNHNNHAVHNSADDKFVLELGKRVRDEVGVTTLSGEKITVIDRKDDGMVHLINAMPGPSPDKKEKSQDRKGGDRRSSGQGVKDERKTLMSQNSSNVPIPISEVMPRPPKTSIEEMMAGREKIQDKEGVQMGADKLILLDPQKCKTPVKDKDRDRERRKDERTKKVENKVYEEEKLRERTKNRIDAADASNDIVFHVLDEVNKIDQSAGDDKKRKNLEPNGFLHENETRQIKLRRPSSLSHPSSVENGRIVDTPRNANRRLLDQQRKPDVVKADKPKEHKPNGIREKKPDLLLSSLDAASLELFVEKQMTRSPHPDLKYLDEVLTVPKFEELVPSEDDREWLYGLHAMQKLREMGSSIEIKEAPQQVWSEAVSLESADIVALPYVVPF